MTTKLKQGRNRGSLPRMVGLRRSTVQKMRELIMDIPSGISRAGDDDCWVQWKEWEQYCIRATKLQNEIDRQIFKKPNGESSDRPSNKEKP